MTDDTANDPDVFRIMIATDNHLGFAERDPIRCDDSFEAFEEVFRAAHLHKVDFLLLGGDLFHDNKPSRGTLYRTMDMFRKYVLGDSDVKFRVHSTGHALQSGVGGRPNFYSPHMSIRLPVFIIHGNHDDPTIEAKNEALSALHILSAANLINYFGAYSNMKSVYVRPIVLQKGRTKIALYGLGYIRDERLARLFLKKRVIFVKPDVEDFESDWCKILVVHQNRDLGVGRKNSLKEEYIPSFFDLVIWGHEHQCLIDPREAKNGAFISQPGSSVVTSLSEGENDAKHFALLEVRGARFRMTPIRFQSVRPFAIRDLSLEAMSGIDPHSPTLQDDVTKWLESQVDDMISHASTTGREASAQPLPLIRIRVDPTGYGGLLPLSNARFGLRFVGRVANPRDILLLQRPRKPRIEPHRESVDVGAARSTAATASAEAEIALEELVEGRLLRQDRKMTLLLEDHMTVALQNFVQREEAHAFHDVVRSRIDATHRTMKGTAHAQSFEEIQEAVAAQVDQERKRRETDRHRPSAPADRSGRSLHEDVEDIVRARAARVDVSDGESEAAVSENEDEDAAVEDEEEDEEPVHARSRATRGGKRGSGSSRATGRGGGRGRGSGSRGGARASAATTRSDVVDIDDDDGHVSDESAQRGGQRAKTSSAKRARSTRGGAAASKRARATTASSSARDQRPQALARSGRIAVGGGGSQVQSTLVFSRTPQQLHTSHEDEDMEEDRVDDVSD